MSTRLDARPALLRHVVILATVAATITLAGCDRVTQAGDKAGICVDALRLAGVVPDTSNPKQAIADAARTAQDLTALANETSDANLKRALQDMAGQYSRFGPADVTPSGLGRWAAAKARQLDNLRSACL